ncbi:MAG TPA: FAD-dependent monooxygenase [Vicinamibacterales bacterium]|nr:FAD-dependent monooxygenase [Vicinamibacterales bacterium]
MIDVLIAGAGPAGSIAATVLARAGARVLVLDRARFPRPKLCGDTLNPGALAVLQRLGLGCAAAASIPLAGMIVTGDDGTRVVGKYEGVSGRAISRSEFDAALMMAAAGAGARIEQGVLVQGPVIDTSGDQPIVTGLKITGRQGKCLTIRARMVIAADGRYSRVARALGLSRAASWPRRWAMGAYFENVGGLTQFGEMHVRRTHYMGVAALAKGLTNACVVTPNLGGRHPADILMTTLTGDAQLRERFAGARMVTAPICLGPLAIDASAAGARGLLLAGDAAGFVDPITGDGLRFAIRGAELAAREALDALENGSDRAHVRLRASRHREFAAKWRFNRTMRWIVTYPAAVRAAEYGVSMIPRLLQEAIRYAGDVHAA